MSIDSIAAQIATVDREINTIEKSIQTLDSNINRKSKEVNDILSKISREKDVKKVITYQKDLQRKNEEINKLENRETSQTSCPLSCGSDRISLRNPDRPHTSNR